jgi:hypothetical protein
MAKTKLVSYKVENEQQLKSHSQQLVDKATLDLGFTTARRDLTIRIGFKKGASHVSWNSKSVVSSAALAKWLMSGFRAGGRRRIKARPAFDNYLQYHSEEMRDICVQAFKRHDSIRNKAYAAGKAVMNDIKRKIYQGSLGLAPNMGKYAEKKYGKGYGDIPLVATKALLNDMEVTIE